MARLRRGGENDHLGTAFQAAALVSLRRAFLSASAHSPAARQALLRFDQTVRSMRFSEMAFSLRERKPGSLLAHLRSAEQLRAIRDFVTAKENLLTLEPTLGGHLVQMALRDAAPVTITSRKAATAVLKIS